MGTPHQPTYDSREAATTGAATSTGGQASVLSDENQPGSPGSESVQVEPKAAILADVSILPSCEMNQSDSRSFDGNRELHKAEQFCLQRSGADLSDVLQLIPLRPHGAMLPRTPSLGRPAPTPRALFEVFGNIPLLSQLAPACFAEWS